MKGINKEDKLIEELRVREHEIIEEIWAIRTILKIEGAEQ